MFDGPVGRGEMPDQSDIALRVGLRAIPSPAASPEFDARVLEQLVQPEPLLRRMLRLATALRPALVAAGVTVPCVLLLVMWLVQAPGGMVAATSAPRAAQALPVEQALDRPDLTPATLRRLSRQEAAVRNRSGGIASRATAA